ncbi:hypothetical protein CDAR_307521 [Caerostris darwini]|uniref:Uncharacterized protein n=1 Tax=Caerostris darwini TaxID=1538125 RepID=A0AAV4T404_9ARAC|nr:hypothetical protein CDAR_307521 [Caerostris darwini]
MRSPGANRTRVCAPVLPQSRERTDPKVQGKPRFIPVKTKPFKKRSSPVHQFARFDPDRSQLLGRGLIPYLPHPRILPWSFGSRNRGRISLEVCPCTGHLIW